MRPVEEEQTPCLMLLSRIQDLKSTSVGSSEIRHRLEVSRIWTEKRPNILDIRWCYFVFHNN